MASKTLWDNIYTLLQGVSNLQDVKKAPGLDFSGWPSAFISPSGLESDYETTQENMRIIAFKVWVLEAYDDQDYSDAMSSLLQAADAVINEFDKEEAPGTTRSLDADLASPYTLASVMAVPSRVISDETEKKLGFEITIRCKVLVDLSQLS